MRGKLKTLSRKRRAQDFPFRREERLKINLKSRAKLKINRARARGGDSSSITKYITQDREREPAQESVTSPVDH